MSRHPIKIDINKHFIEIDQATTIVHQNSNFRISIIESSRYDEISLIIDLFTFKMRILRKYYIHSVEELQRVTKFIDELKVNKTLCCVYILTLFIDLCKLTEFRDSLLKHYLNPISFTFTSPLYGLGTVKEISSNLLKNPTVIYQFIEHSIYFNFDESLNIYYKVFIGTINGLKDTISLFKYPLVKKEPHVSLDVSSMGIFRILLFKFLQSPHDELPLQFMIPTTTQFEELLRFYTVILYLFDKGLFQEPILYSIMQQAIFELF